MKLMVLKQQRRSKEIPNFFRARGQVEGIERENTGFANGFFQLVRVDVDAKLLGLSLQSVLDGRFS